MTTFEKTIREKLEPILPKHVQLLDFDENKKQFTVKTKNGLRDYVYFRIFQKIKYNIWYTRTGLPQWPGDGMSYERYRPMTNTEIALAKSWK